MNMKCKHCGTDLVAIEVRHPVWVDGCIGTGEVRTEIRWYCPKCEEKPKGRPILSSDAEEIQRSLW